MSIYYYCQKDQFIQSNVCVALFQMIPAIQSFIVDNMGQKYIEPPTFDLSLSYRDSSYFTPLVFVLSPGADPMAMLYRFAEEQGKNLKQFMPRFSI